MSLTTPAQAITTVTVNTLQLRSGDVVWLHGMRVLLGERGQAPSRVEGLSTPIVVWFHGTVTNAATMADDALASKGLRTDSRCADCQPGEHWQVQGNERAHWHREV